jgi:hypothetical protein
VGDRLVGGDLGRQDLAQKGAEDGGMFVGNANQVVDAAGLHEGVRYGGAHLLLPRAAPRTWWSPLPLDCLGQSPGSRHLRRHPAKDQRPNFGRHSLREAGGESLILGLSVLTPNEDYLVRPAADPSSALRRRSMLLPVISPPRPWIA